MNDDAATGNYPPPGDSTHPLLQLSSSHLTLTSPCPATSSGGYGSSQNSWSDKAQRGNASAERASDDTGLVDQSTNGGDLAGEVQDAQQGQDADTRRDFKPAGRGLDPYDRNPDSKEEVREMLASAYSGRRGEQYESSGATGNDADVGA